MERWYQGHSHRSVLSAQPHRVRPSTGEAQRCGGNRAAADRVYYADVPPSAHPLTGPRCLSPSHQFSPPGLGISADESQNRETRGHETSLSVPSNAARKQRKISANQIPEVPAPHNEPSSGSLEASPSSAPSRQVSSSSTPYADPSTYLSTTRSAIRASRWLQQQIVEPTIGSSADTISQGRGICGQSIYTLLFDEDLLCFECGKHQDKRTRAITHQRVHFNHKPFRCEGDCGRKSWCVSYSRDSISALIPFSRVRFACRDAKQGHCTRTKEKKTKCDSWCVRCLI